MKSAFPIMKCMRGDIRVGLYPQDPRNGLIDRHRPARILEWRNLILYGGADVIARVLGGDAEYKIGAMYFEFENMTNPLDPITPPSYDRSKAQGLPYYQGLASPRDYMRIPIAVTPSIMSSDPVKYDGNQVTFFAVTGGSLGVNGLTFSETQNSTVFGVALAATPVIADPTLDVVFARAYFPTPNNKFLKAAGHSIGVDWSVRIY